MHSFEARLTCRNCGRQLPESASLGHLRRPPGDLEQQASQALGGDG